MLACVFLPACGALSQAAPAKIVYDAVAIKPNKSGSGNVMWRGTRDGFTATNITLKMLLVNAYGIRDGLIFGLPGWAESEHFDINAKMVDADPDALKKLTKEQRQEMMAIILTERFRVKVHTETKIVPVYDLVVTRDGPKFQPSTVPPLPPPDPKEPAAAKPVTPGRMGPGSIMVNNGELTSVGIPIANLIGNLENELDRSVIDKTGLTATYDLTLKWLPEREAGNDSGRVDPPPPLFIALQEQLGLKLQPGKGPVQTLVVDHVEEPTEN